MKGLASCWLTIPSVGLSAAISYTSEEFQLGGLLLRFKLLKSLLLSSQAEIRTHIMPKLIQGTNVCEQEFALKNASACP
jgi:hypothetical protein